MKQQNKVLIRGTVNKIELTANISIITVITYGNGKFSAPQITFYDRDLSKEFSCGDKVTVEAYIHNRTLRRNDSKIYIQELAGISIKRTERALKFYLPDSIPIKESGYPQRDENFVAVVGKCEHTYHPSPNIMVITLSVPREQYLHYCDITCYKRQSEAAAGIQEGEYVAIIGAIQTEEVNKKLQKTVSQNIVCKDIAVIDPAFIEVGGN